MFKDIIITISREYGSGGRIVGKKLAEKLGIAFYDNELITLAAQQTGMSEEFLKNTEEKASHSLGFSLTFLGGLGYNMPLNDKVFIAQSQIIRDVAAKGPCVIVGRCADYVLKDNAHTMNIFIHSNINNRMKTATERYDFPTEKTKALITKIDKQRETYYNYYTDHIWGKADNYHLCVDTGAIGIESAVDVIATFAEQFSKKSKV